MRFLLINDNPAVSRLIKLSVEKLEGTLDETASFDEIPASGYDVALIDNECFEEEKTQALKDKGTCKHVVFIASKNQEKPSAANSIISKPFLPTDFLDLANKVSQELGGSFPEPASNDVNSFEEEEEVDTSLLEEMNLEDDLGSLDSLEPDSMQESEEDESDMAVAELPEDIETLELDDLGLDEEIIKQSEEENEAQSLEDFEDDEAEGTAVLDSEEIDEVKQLLQESEEESSEEEDLLASLDFTTQEDEEENLVLNETPLTEENLEDEFGFNSVEEPKLEEASEDDELLAGFDFEEENKEEKPLDEEDAEMDDELFGEAGDVLAAADLLDEQDEKVSLEEDDELLNELDDSSNEDLEETKVDALELPSLNEELEEETKEETDALEDSDMAANLEDELIEEDELALDEESKVEDELASEEDLGLDIGDLEKELDAIEIEDDLNLEKEEEAIAPLEEEMELEDASMEELETKLDSLIEETEQSEAELDLGSDAMSIDDISENEFLKAFNEEVIEENDALEEENFVEEAVEEIKEEDTNDIEDEIQTVISESVKEALSSSGLKEKLKGLKLNISITFDEV